MRFVEENSTREEIRLWASTPGAEYPSEDWYLLITSEHAYDDRGHGRRCREPGDPGTLGKQVQVSSKWPPVTMRIEALRSLFPLLPLREPRPLHCTEGPRVFEFEQFEAHHDGGPRPSGGR